LRKLARQCPPIGSPVRKQLQCFAQNSAYKSTTPRFGALARLLQYGGQVSIQMARGLISLAQDPRLIRQK